MESLYLGLGRESPWALDSSEMTLKGEYGTWSPHFVFS
jgi:hypothetical protein